MVKGFPNLVDKIRGAERCSHTDPRADTERTFAIVASHICPVPCCQALLLAHISCGQSELQPQDRPVLLLSNQ
jgi:hypothetical protein